MLADRVRVLGKDHPDTLATRHEMIFYRGLAGAPAGAARAFELLLPDRERVLGKDHPDTLVTRHGLARMRGEAGDPDAAVADYESLLADRERVLRPDHLDTLVTQHGLAFWRGQAGDLAGAVRAFEHLVERMLRVLGPDYRDTLQARWVLAELRGLAGDTPAALAELRQLLADEERVFGPDHPDTLAVRRSVAERLEETEGPAAAIAEYEWLLAAGLRVLGPDHPDTLITRHYLGVCRGKAGAPAAAVAELELLLADRARVRGADHPDTLATRSSIGYWLGEAGDPAGAVAAYRDLLAETERTSKPGDVTAAKARQDLAGALISHGRELLGAARSQLFSTEGSGVMSESGIRSESGLSPETAWFEPALACFTEALELTNADREPGFYGVILHDIAYTYETSGDLQTALAHYRRSVEHKVRGSEPDDLATTRMALGECLIAAGELAEARTVLDQTVQGLAQVPPAERAVDLHAAGRAYEALGKRGLLDAYATALVTYQASLELIDPGDDPGSYGTVLRDIGDIHTAEGRLDEAEKSYADGIEHMRHTPGAEHTLASMLLALGRLKRRIGSAKKAASAATGPAGIAEPAPPDDAEPLDALTGDRAASQSPYCRHERPHLLPSCTPGHDRAAWPFCKASRSPKSARWPIALITSPSARRSPICSRDCSCSLIRRRPQCRAPPLHSYS